MLMRYLDYEAIVDYDEVAGLFHGEVTNRRDVINFQGTSIDALSQAFAESVEDDLEFCSNDRIKRAPEQAAH